MEVQQTLLNTLWREDTGLLGGAGVCVCVCVEGNGNPLQYSCLGNPMDKEAWQAIVHGVTRVRDDLELNHHLFQMEASKQNINFSRS